jgi:hypothetical protein
MMKNGWQHVHKLWGMDGMKMKAWNEDDKLGQYIKWMWFGQWWMKRRKVTGSKVQQ